MAKKTKLSATLPDGTVATRTTARAYTHVLAVAWDNAIERERAFESAATIQGYVDDGSDCWTQETADEYKAKAEAHPATGVTWSAYSWHSSRELAEKGADTARKRLSRLLAEIRLVPVNFVDPS